MIKRLWKHIVGLRNKITRPTKALLFGIPLIDLIVRQTYYKFPMGVVVDAQGNEVVGGWYQAGIGDHIYFTGVMIVIGISYAALYGFSRVTYHKHPGFNNVLGWVVSMCWVDNIRQILSVFGIGQMIEPSTLGLAMLGIFTVYIMAIFVQKKVLWEKQ